MAHRAIFSGNTVTTSSLRHTDTRVDRASDDELFGVHRDIVSRWSYRATATPAQANSCREVVDDRPNAVADRSGYRRYVRIVSAHALRHCRNC